MPDDRFIHRRLGHSERVNTLTDFEFRVWTQYLLSSDDFGVMRFSAATLQADCDALTGKNAKAVQRAVERLAIVGLVRTFVHQNRTYCYQHDWQDWQKVEYPRATLHPIPPLDGMTDATRKLFGKFPGGWGRGKSNGSPNVPQTLVEHLENVPQTFGEASGTITPEPLAVSHEPLAVSRGPVLHPARRHGLQTLHRTGHHTHAFCSERICVPDFLHDKFRRALGGHGSDAGLRQFYEETVNGIPDSQPIDSDPLKFWPPFVAARWPPASSHESKLTAALKRSSAGFLASIAEGK